MSKSDPSPVVLFEHDGDMEKAARAARKTFRYFWRELTWERHRIIPGLDVACIKVAFSDGKDGPARKDEPEVEHMWLSDVEFDGKKLSGTLLNDPNWLNSVKAGDSVKVSPKQMSDWMYVCMGEVCGGFTVNLMRSRMNKRERAEHDTAWGQDFGDPAVTQLVPSEKGKRGKGLLGGLLGGGKSEEFREPPVEHPMSENMAPGLSEKLQEDPAFAKTAGEEGWTQLHTMALAGSTACVNVLVEHGADINAVTNNGMTPLALAKVFGWTQTIAVLEQAGAKK